MRLIDADALKETIASNVYMVVDYFNSKDFGMFWTGGIEKAIDEQPTVDAVEVVRCKDCVHKPHVVDVFHASYGDIPVLDSNGKCPCINEDDYFYSHMPDDDWFCANGERREADGSN